MYCVTLINVLHWVTYYNVLYNVCDCFHHVIYAWVFYLTSLFKWPGFSFSLLCHAACAYCFSCWLKMEPLMWSLAGPVSCVIVVSGIQRMTVCVVVKSNDFLLLYVIFETRLNWLLYYDFWNILSCGFRCRI